MAPFFKMRRASRFAQFDAAGYWSYPAFLADKSGDLLWLHLVAPTAQPTAGGPQMLFKPKALVVTLPNSPVVVRFENFRVGRDLVPSVPWNKPLALLLHPGVVELPRKEFAERERVLLQECVTAGEVFVKERRLPDAFKSEYLKLQNPFFLPWLKLLSPTFYAALTPV